MPPYIDQLIHKYLITCIAGEVDLSEPSTASEIAKNRDLTHVVIEPTPEERLKLGSFDLEGEIWKLMEEHGIDNWPSDKEEDELPHHVYAKYSESRSKSHRDREKEWWRRIERTNKWPTLVICGYGHFYPFKDKFIELGLEVIEANDCWIG